MTGPNTRQDIERIYRLWDQALGNRDLEASLALYAQDASIESPLVQHLLNTKEGITRSRGKWHKWRDIPVMITYHPSYLLRQYNQQAKREAWEDLKTLLHFV